MFTSICLKAQTVQGSIHDERGNPLISALILNQSNNQHTHSDYNGGFKLKEVVEGDTLVISFLSYKTILYVVKNTENVVKISLEEAPLSINEVVILPGLDAIKVFSDIDVKVQPVNSSQDVLRQVPGLFIGQHAGGGKAEQIFLRGFDIDHGTDIRLTVDGLPINMVSHAHGQGYADLHFIIPETIEKVNFGKGSYNADQGNFATAGYVDFKTKDRLDNNIVKAEIGQFGTQRLMTMLSLSGADNTAGYIAAEYLLSDGPFESNQNFERVNLFGKYRFQLSDNQHLSLLSTYFKSTWDASGQIPQRAVNDGSITRFGAIDDTEGGSTSRVNLSLTHKIDISDHSAIENQLYYSYYDFLLFSNFTFFLNDPLRGDQIKQEEARSIYGVNTSFRSFHDLLGGTLDFKTGIQLRADNSNNNRLANTANRTELLSNIQFGDIKEDNLGFYTDANFTLSKWTFNAGLRWDHFRYNYLDKTQTAFDSQTTNASILSPKFNLLYNHSRNLQYYLKSGLGFHSNDTRVAIAQNGLEILPAAYSVDLGVIAKPFKNLLLNIALWNLFLEQEFVYVGDAGIVEPSGRSRRQGIDFSGRYQFSDWLYYNFDANYTLAKSIDEPDESNNIPLAPLTTISSGLSINHHSGIYGGINLRHIGDRPANEDNSIVAKGYTVVDANVGYTWNKLSFGVQIQNLLNVEWNETQFATESRLINETESVEEIHFTPGVPFFAKGIFSYSF